MRFRPTPPLGLLRVLLALLSTCGLVLGSACADETGDETLVASGTGSSGGNPATLRFELTTDDAPQESNWTRGILAASEVTFARAGEDGECVFGAERLPLGAFIDLVRSPPANLDVEGLCRIGFRTDGEAPLVSLQGSLRERNFELDLMLPEGFDLVFDSAPPRREGEHASVVVTLAIGRLLQDIDVGDIPPPGSTIRITDQDDGTGLVLLQNIADSIVIYADPTPGDGQITRAERTPDNRIGHLELR